MLLPLLVVLIVFILIAARRIGSHHVEIWQVMGMGALAVLITGQISIVDALISINMDVMLFLFGMFVLGVALEDSGYLLHISHRIFRHARNGDQVLLLLLFSAGFASAILMNDTLAIIGTPLVLFLAKVHRMNSKILLLGLAYAVTIGSAMSPIGNPQNLLIAINGGMEAPFVTFFMILLLPTVANLIIAFVLLKLLFKSDLECCVIDDQVGQTVLNHRQARACRISLII
ncbi:MAG: SLC13 family permease, partial [Candidatus Thorarchaeota archaeon]